MIVLPRAAVQAWAKPSQLLRPYVAEVARRPQYSHVVFAEIDVDQLSVSTCFHGMCGSCAWRACEEAHAAEHFMRLALLLLNVGSGRRHGCAGMPHACVLEEPAVCGGVVCSEREGCLPPRRGVVALHMCEYESRDRW